jgi:hypothetical protein
VNYVTRGDIVLITIMLAVAAAGFVLVPHIAGAGGHAVVEVDGQRELDLPLDRDVTITVTGPSGDSVIIVEDGAVRVGDSICPHHICMNMGRLRYPGEVAVCVPNRLVITVRGKSGQQGFDGVTQ